MRSGFLQVDLTPESQVLTAVWVGKSLWCYRRLPFGLKQSVALFARRVDNALAMAKLTHCACAYVDDVAVFSKDFESHLEHIQQVMAALIDVGFKLHPDKSIFCADSLPFLGHMVGPTGIGPEEAKVAAIKALPEPKSAEEVRSVLGFIGFYRCYVPRFSEIAEPLRRLQKKDAKWEWGEEQQQAFRELKAALLKPGAALRHPDPTLPYVVYTDFSTKGLAATLNQRQPDGTETLVACVSRSLNKHEQQYPIWKGEALAAVYGIRVSAPMSWASTLCWSRTTRPYYTCSQRPTLQVRCPDGRRPSRSKSSRWCTGRAPHS